jgi:hypothetical protein
MGSNVDLLSSFVTEFPNNSTFEAVRGSTFGAVRLVGGHRVAGLALAEQLVLTDLGQI